MEGTRDHTSDPHWSSDQFGKTVDRNIHAHPLSPPPMACRTRLMRRERTVFGGRHRRKFRALLSRLRYQGEGLGEILGVSSIR
jgi:hypothetical protein